MMPAGTFGSRCKGMFTIPVIQVRVQLQFALEGTRELSTGLSHHDKEFFLYLHHSLCRHLYPKQLTIQGRYTFIYTSSDVYSLGTEHMSKPQHRS